LLEAVFVFNLEKKFKPKHCAEIELVTEGLVQHNVCAMVAGHPGMKYIYLLCLPTWTECGFNKPPLRKHKL